MDPLTSAAVAWAGGRIASWLTPSRYGSARRQSQQAENTLNTYRQKYDEVARGGADTIASYSPRLDTAINDYSTFLSQDPRSDPSLQYDLAQQNEGLNMDARRAAARVARELRGDDSASMGATAGALTAIEDRRLSGEAAARAEITKQNLLQREARKRAQVQLLAEQVARGQGEFMTGLSGGQGISSANLQIALGREGQALQQDGATLAGWQGLAAELARAYSPKRK